jgi:cytosine/adenosine deaminase-related metal-dependent hydrolase
MIDLRKPVNPEEVVGGLRDWFRSHPNWHGGFGLAPHAPYTASAELYSEAARIARRDGLPFTTHLAESPEEMQMFRNASGPLFDFLKSIGCALGSGGSETPLSFLLRSQKIDEPWIIAHLNELDAADFDRLEHTPKFQIAHCPRSHTALGHGPFALQRLRALGFNISLGTDSLASNSSLSLFAEMRELLRKEPWLSPKQAVEMITVNAAAALGRADSLGRIHTGFLADLVALPFKGPQNAIFENIVTFEHNVPWMMVNGEVLSRP